MGANCSNSWVNWELTGRICEHRGGYQVTIYLAKIFASIFAEDSAGNQVYTCVGGNQVFRVDLKSY
jgi:hypothetical protein